MSFDTYTNLQTEITDLLNRGDLASKVPSWISLCEAQIQRIIEARDQRTLLNVTFDTTGILTLPAGYGVPVSLTLETSLRTGPIEMTTYERLQQKRQQLVNGVPGYAAVVGNSVYLAPVPDASYTGVLIYDATVTPLSSTNASNWVLASHPDVYLYGAAVHSAPYLKDDDRLPMWQSLFQKAIDEIRTLRDRAEFGGNTPIMRPKSALGQSTYGGYYNN